MILRRVIDHFRKQEWTAIFLDFVIVVAGVFMGIQVANWNAARADHVREQGYIERLATDFEAIIERSEGALDRWQSVVMASKRLRADIKEYRANGALSRPMNAFKDDFADISGGQIPAPRAPTFVEMLSAGDVALIRDPALRNELFAYESQAHFALEAYRVLASRTEASVNILSRFSEIDTAETPLDSYLPGARDPIETIDLAAFASDPEAETAVKIIGSAADNHRGLTVTQLQYAHAALDALKSAQK